MTSTLFPDDIFDLAAIAREVAERDPERVAVIAPDGRNRDGSRRYRKHSYRELSDDVESVAIGLRELGIRERTRTVFMTPPSYEGCVAGLALTRVGATTVWIDPSVGYLNVAERLRRLEVEAFIGIPLAHLARTAFGWGPRFRSRAIVVDGWFPGAHTLASLRRSAPAVPSAPWVGPDAPAAIMYTTGSTGPAKPTLYEHRNLCNIFRLVHRTWRFDRDAGVVDMPVFPAFFSVGLSAGGTIVIPPIDYVRQSPGDVDPAALLEVIRDCRVQTLFASPVILQNLSRLGRDQGATARTLRTVIGGGAPLYADVVAPLRAMLGDGGEVHADYGATEALPATELAGHETIAASGATARGRGLCVGRPFDGVDLKVIAIVDGPVASLADARELPTGEIGEIIVRGPHVSPRYADDAASTRDNKIADSDGGVWHRLGDAGYLDAAGRLWCAGRVGHRVELAGGTLFPLMCEPIFDAHPRVRRSALVGVTSSHGVTPVLCVELQDGAVRGRGLDAVRDELLALAAEHPTTRAIRSVLFHPRLPVDPRHNSKIERPALRRWATEKLPKGDSMTIASRIAVALLVIASMGLMACVEDPGDDYTESEELELGSSDGITVTGQRWISPRTLEVDVSTAYVAPIAVNGPHRIRITFPIGYDADPSVRYPVVYLLHGGAGGNSAQWTTGGGTVEEITDGRPVITVMADGGKVGWFTNWVDQSRGAQRWADFYLDQVIPWVDHNLRTVAARDGRAIAGLSMGGHGAVRLAQDRPELFQSVASFSGAVDLGDLGTRAVVTEQAVQYGFGPFSVFGSPFAADSAWTTQDPMKRAARLSGMQVLLYAGAGISDVDVLERTMGASANRFHRALDTAGVPHFWWMYGRPGPAALYGCDGGHNFGCWNLAFDDSLPRMLSVLKTAPVPVGTNLIVNGSFEHGRAQWHSIGVAGGDVGLGFARSGAGNGWVRSDAGWNDVHQTVPVLPNRNYKLTGWIRTSANNHGGYFGIRSASGQVLGEKHFEVLGPYTQFTVTVSSGANRTLEVFGGTWASGDTWVQLDDVSLVEL